MSLQSDPECEVREIAIAANSGEATDDQLARLDELIRSDQQLANYAARLFEQQASLAWHGSGIRCQVSGVGNHVSVSDTRHPTPDTSPRWAWPAIAVGIGFVLGSLAAGAIYRSIGTQAAQMAAVTDPAAVSGAPYE